MHHDLLVPQPEGSLRLGGHPHHAPVKGATRIINGIAAEAFKRSNSDT